jgi:hypothetical protein
VYFPQVSLADFEPASARLESAMNRNSVHDAVPVWWTE